MKPTMSPSGMVYKIRCQEFEIKILETKLYIRNLNIEKKDVEENIAEQEGRLNLIERDFDKFRDMNKNGDLAQ